MFHDRGVHGVDATATTADIRDRGAHEEDVPRRGALEIDAIATATDTRDGGVQEHDDPRPWRTRR